MLFTYSLLEALSHLNWFKKEICRIKMSFHSKFVFKILTYTHKGSIYICPVSILHVLYHSQMSQILFDRCTVQTKKNHGCLLKIAKFVWVRTNLALPMAILSVLIITLWFLIYRYF